MTLSGLSILLIFSLFFLHQYPIFLSLVVIVAIRGSTACWWGGHFEQKLLQFEASSSMVAMVLWWLFYATDLLVVGLKFIPFPFYYSFGSLSVADDQNICTEKLVQGFVHEMMAMGFWCLEEKRALG